MKKRWDDKWKHVENMMIYFQKEKRKELHSLQFRLKTVVLDENVKDLLSIHKYCVEDLQCDTHAFQFLKGLPYNILM